MNASEEILRKAEASNLQRAHDGARFGNAITNVLLLLVVVELALHLFSLHTEHQSLEHDEAAKDMLSLRASYVDELKAEKEYQKFMGTEKTENEKTLVKDIADIDAKLKALPPKKKLWP